MGLVVLVHAVPSTEGGPDVDHVLGVFSSRERSREARRAYEESETRWRGGADKVPGGLFADSTFSEVEDGVEGPVVLVAEWDFHGESQCEFVGAFATRNAARAAAAEHDGKFSDGAVFSVEEYAVDGTSRGT